MDIGSILTAGGAGGLFGILGQIGNRAVGIWESREKRKDMVIQNAQEEKRWGHETNLLTLQMQAKREETEQEQALAETAGAWNAFTGSQAAEASIGKSYPWVEAVRALARPFLTLEAQILLAIVYFTLRGEARSELLAGIVETVTFCASASLLWWFGERAQQRVAGKR